MMGCEATRIRKFSKPILRRSTKSGSMLSADNLCQTNSACVNRIELRAAKFSAKCKAKWVEVSTSLPFFLAKVEQQYVDS